MFVVALTGGIGSGKSTVGSLFSKHEVPIIDADQLARQVVEPDSTAQQEIITRFGNKVLTENQMDRAKLRDLIFHDPNQREWLENLIHPLVCQKIIEQTHQLQASYCIVMIPLLFESMAHYQLRDEIHHIVVVDLPIRLQKKRVQMRDQLDLILIEKIMAQQASRSKKLMNADDVLYNDGSIEQLTWQVARLNQKFKQLSMSK